MRAYAREEAATRRTQPHMPSDLHRRMITGSRVPRRGVSSRGENPYRLSKLLTCTFSQNVLIRPCLLGPERGVRKLRRSDLHFCTFAARFAGKRKPLTCTFVVPLRSDVGRGFVA